MRPPYITHSFLDQFVKSALAEDVGEGDHSTLAVVDAAETGCAKLLVKETGTVAGIELSQEIFLRVDSSLKQIIHIKDGTTVAPGEIAFTVEGPLRSILTAERLILNCMQRMSGIATRTRRLVELVEGTGSKILDTRKTTPNFRLPEKWAVLIGGGENHRIGLYDRIMIKDNHIKTAGSVAEAVNRVKAYLRAKNKKLMVEAEVKNLAEVRQVLATGGVDVIMLDNMSLSEMKESVKIIAGRCATEASGSITELNIRDVAMCGVDYISVGALTHSVKSLDLSLKVY